SRASHLDLFEQPGIRVFSRARTGKSWARLSEMNSFPHEVSRLIKMSKVKTRPPGTGRPSAARWVSTPNQAEDQDYFRGEPTNVANPDALKVSRRRLQPSC